MMKTLHRQNSLRNNLLLAVVLLLLCGCGGRLNIANLDSTGETIICFGNSITQGLGVAPKKSFPYLLSEKLGKKVINAGVSGDTTRDALRRLEKDVLSKNPKLVIIEFGANDFFQKIPKEETYDNINRIIDKVHEEGAMVALATVKIGLVRDTYDKGFKKIARTHEVLLIPDIMKGIFANPKLMVDGLHPNEEGHRIIAERIHQAIKILLEST